MNESIRFETPENIEVSYQLTGPGTRFVAWFTDQIVMFFLGIIIFFLLMCAGVALEGVVRSLEEPLQDFSGDLGDPERVDELPFYFFGLMVLIWGLGSFFYFGCSELFLRGQTLGKRSVGIRVVKADGFSLDGISILVRNIFRVVDHFPALWIVPVLSEKSQRLGDMVAGTIVITDKPEPLSEIRELLSQRSAAESHFRFDATLLKRLRPQDFTAVERLLERCADLSPEKRKPLIEQAVAPLAKRLDMEIPSQENHNRFLEDLLAAEYRRQNRQLG